jgi:transposase
MASNSMKYAALWLLDQGRTMKHVAKIHRISVRSLRRWVKNKEKVREKNRNDLLKHFS